MNLLSNGYIWLLPERHASRATFDTLQQNGLNVIESIGYVPVFSRGYTHETNIPEKYLSSQYPLVINVRNPYIQAVSLWRLNQTIAVRPHATVRNPFPDTNDRMPLLFDEILEGEDGTGLTKVYLNEPPLCKTFNEWVHCINEKDSNKFNRNSNPHKLPNKEPDYVVKVENLKEDLLKIPGITKVSTANPCTAQYFTTVMKYIIINYAINGKLDNDYFIKFIESNKKVSNALFNAKPKTYPQLLLKKTYKQLQMLPTDKLQTFIKNYFIVPEGFAEKTKLIDLYQLFSNEWKSFYNQELADIVYEDRKEWFIKFGYDRDSWKS